MISARQMFVLSFGLLWLWGCHTIKTTHPQPPGATPFVTHYSSGQKRAEGAYLRNKRHGYFVRWHTNGARSFEGRFVHGQPHGIHVFWNKYGRTQRRMTHSRKGNKAQVHIVYFIAERVRRELLYVGAGFKQRLIREAIWVGKHRSKQKDVFPDGRVKKQMWSSNGTPTRLRWYKNHRLHGVAKDWFPGGKLAFHGAYHRGLQVGVVRRWFPDGRRQSVFGYRKTPCSSTSVHRKKRRVKWRSCPHGWWRKWYSTGRLALRGQFRDGAMIGHWQSWHKNGQLTSSTHYRRGLAVGQSKGWHPNGKLAHLVTYIRGLKHGNSVYWHNNGQKGRSTPYTRGLIDGVRRSWGPLGRLRSEERFSKGLYHGLSIWYFPNGEPIRKLRYWRAKLCGKSIEFTPTGAIKKQRQYPSCASMR